MAKASVVRDTVIGAALLGGGYAATKWRQARYRAMSPRARAQMHRSDPGAAASFERNLVGDEEHQRRENIRYAAMMRARDAAPLGRAGVGVGG